MLLCLQKAARLAYRRLCPVRHRHVGAHRIHGADLGYARHNRYRDPHLHDIHADIRFGCRGKAQPYARSRARGGPGNAWNSRRSRRSTRSDR